MQELRTTTRDKRERWSDDNNFGTNIRVLAERGHCADMESWPPSRRRVGHPKIAATERRPTGLAVTYWYFHAWHRCDRQFTFLVRRNRNDYSYWQGGIAVCSVCCLGSQFGCGRRRPMTRDPPVDGKLRDKMRISSMYGKALHLPYHSTAQCCLSLCALLALSVR